MKFKKIEEIKEFLFKKNEIELTNKKEFLFLKNFIFDFEDIINISVCDVDGIINIIVVTSWRVIFIKKNIMFSSEIKQFGLEKISDIKVNKDFDTKIIIELNLVRKVISSISENEIIKLGKDIANATITLKEKKFK